MIAAAREWLIGVVSVTLLLSVAQTLVPEGAMRRMAAFCGGLILLSVLVQPVLKIDLTDLTPDISGYEEAVRQRQAELEQAESEALAARIAEGAEAYISEKADELGLTLGVRVLTAPGEDGTPVPDAAELTGPYSGVLARWLEETLGIPAERQVWHEGKN